MVPSVISGAKSMHTHRTTVECLTGWCCPALPPAFCFSTGDARSSPHVCLQIITTAYTRKPPCCWVLKPTFHWRHSAASNDELCFFSPLFLLDSLGDTGTGDYCFPYECIPWEYYGFQIGSLNIGMQLDVVLLIITMKSSLKSAFNYSVAQNKGWVLKSL